MHDVSLPPDASFPVGRQAFRAMRWGWGMQLSTSDRPSRGRLRSSLAAMIAVAIAVALLLHEAVPARAQSPAPPQQTEEQRRAEARAAWNAAVAAGAIGPQDVALVDQGTFSVPEGIFFIPKREGARLMRALGNTVNGDVFLGLVATRRNGERWIAELDFVKDGYIRDGEARNWEPDALLANLKEGTERDNADRRERGFPEMEIVGWIEKPSYDAATHRLVWSLSLKAKNAAPGQDATVNYNTYLLGREGYFALDFVTDAARVEAEKPIARDLLAHLSFSPGKRYEDFNEDAGDKVATYGIAALVGGIAAKKLGLLALLAAFAIKFVKLIALGAIAIVAFVSRLFKRKPPVVSDAGIERSRPPE